jgi:toxin-antitoxin system PIN domain toxin
MKIPDLNVLLYARDSRSGHHDTASAWIEEGLSGAEAVGFATVALLGFVRISTNAHIMEQPLSSRDAIDQVRQWLSAPAARAIHPGAGHFETLGLLLQASGTAGNLTTDAHLAALAIEHQATLASFDGDFQRFESLSFQYLR